MRYARKFLDRTYDVVTGQLSFPVPPNKEDTTASVVLSATWADTSLMFEAVLNPDTTGSSHTAEEAAIEELKLTIGEVINGVSVEVIGYAPNGTNGTYNIKVIGFS